MANNKVVFGEEVLIDLTQDTVTPYALEEGYTAHAPSGETIVGVMKPNKPVEVETNAEMTAISTGATENDLGKVYLFVGEDDGVFEKDALYILVKKGTGYGFQRYAIGGSGGGSQECDCIIDVTELPTENIDEQSIYRVASGGVEMYAVIENYGTLQVMTLSDLLNGANITATLVETTPTSVPLSDQSTMTLYVYVVASGDDAGYGYIDMGSGPMTLGAMLGMPEGDNGFSEDISAETELGFYAVLAEATYTFHAYKDGSWTELATKKNVRVDITHSGVQDIRDGKCAFENTIRRGFPHGTNLECVYYPAYHDAINGTYAYSTMPYLDSDGSLRIELYTSNADGSEAYTSYKIATT